ncbi:MAG: hypothetical protein M5U26_02490 [Planctomycetota bacterium]|nr:hypothetical protein [Planctomycetota bacterium]
MSSGLFDRSRLKIRPLAERAHDLDLGAIRPLAPVDCTAPALAEAGRRIKAARARGAAVVLMMGAHVLRSGVQRYLIDWMERGLISVLSTNGALAIHDYEWARIGATTESVARYIKDGRFGLWQETGELNEIVSCGAREGLGLGEAVGKAIAESGFPNREISVLAAAYRLGVPFTVHVGIGYDIVHEHPNCDGAAYGAASYHDFLRFARVVEDLDGGVVMNFGSAVMAPEVYLKALAMARNVAEQEGRTIRDFTTLVCDLHELPDDFQREPSRGEAAYYYRPWKTMLVRTVADGGRSLYVCGKHADTVPQLWTATTS